MHFVILIKIVMCVMIMYEIRMFFFNFAVLYFDILKLLLFKALHIVLALLFIFQVTYTLFLLFMLICTRFLLFMVYFDKLMIMTKRKIQLPFKVREIFPEIVANQVNNRVRMHEFVYMICRSRGKYFKYFKLKIH